MTSKTSATTAIANATADIARFEEAILTAHRNLNETATTKRYPGGYDAKVRSVKAQRAAIQKLIDQKTAAEATLAQLQAAAAEEKKTARRQNPAGTIIVQFADDPASISFSDAKAARRWLRKHGLTVNSASKSGSNWNFPGPKPASK